MCTQAHVYVRAVYEHCTVHEHVLSLMLLHIDLLQCQKRPTTVSKETYYSVKKDLLQCQKRHTKVSKETYYSVKRDLVCVLRDCILMEHAQEEQWKKQDESLGTCMCVYRPTTVSKETYCSVKRDLLQCQKRPTTVSNFFRALLCLDQVHTHIQLAIHLTKHLPNI